jgi:phosphoglycolate phosphatase
MIPRAIIYDFDGTLVDSADDILLCLHQALQAQGLKAPPSMGRTWIGPPIAEILDKSGIPMDTSIRDSVVSSFRELYDHSSMANTKPYEGALNMLTRSKELGIRMFVATNKPIEPTRLLVRKWFSDFFETLVCVDSMPGRRLSKTEMVTILLHSQDLDPSETWVVGDGTNDIEAAIRCGCLPVGVAFGYGDPSELLRAGASRILSSLDELLEKEDSNDESQ